VRLDHLARINAAIAARQAIALVSDLASGEAAIVTLEDPPSSHAAHAEIAEAFRSGKSGLVEVAGQRFFINVHLPPVKVVITGAVHISQALAEMAKPLGLDVAIVDPRTAFATEERFPGARLLAEWPDVALPTLGLDRFTAFVALTHDPKIDDPGLDAALRAGCFYIGALGSRKTHARRVERLAAARFSEAQIAGIRAPIGLDIGAVSPAEIAVSILGEIIAAMRAKRRT
jgi:xanthine dehydrogenase accessory factor